MPKIDNYYNRFKEEYTEILFRDDKGTQASEMNEMQSIFNARVSKIAHALFKDGDILSDAQISVNANTGEVKAQNGRIFIAGSVWDIEACNFEIPRNGTIAVGIRLVETVISEMEDAGLRNPAVGSRGEGEPGAWRKQILATWAYDGDGTDKNAGDFFPVYMVDDCIQRAKEAPPNLDSFNMALARYDRDSTGTGTYAVSGLMLVAGQNLDDGRQVYHLSEGRGRVSGMGIELTTSRRIVYDPEPDLRFLDMEIHTATADSTSENGQRITVNHAPIKDVTGLRITQEKTASIIHGAYSGVADNLPDTALVSIESVQQGDTVYISGTDYIKTGDTVDWSPAGNEPTPGSTYEVTYRCIENVTPTNLDADGFTVTGAVDGTQIMVSYNQMLPRIDCLVMTYDGLVTWFKGVSSAINPKKPIVPTTMLALATVFQDWRPIRNISNDAVRVVPFDEITRINNRLDYALQEIARQALESDVSTRESGARAGLFVDPLINDSMRDQGIEQSAAIVGGFLTLPIISAVALQPHTDIEHITARDFTVAVILEQPFRTADMQVNPYMAFDPLPAKVTLKPAVDHWTETQTKWASAVTEIFNQGSGSVNRTTVSTSSEMVGSNTQRIENLRQINVNFKLQGFSAGEHLESITFDGVAVNGM